MSTPYGIRETHKIVGESGSLLRMADSRQTSQDSTGGCMTLPTTCPPLTCLPLTAAVRSHQNLATKRPQPRGLKILLPMVGSPQVCGSCARICQVHPCRRTKVITSTDTWMQMVIRDCCHLIWNIAIMKRILHHHRRAYGSRHQAAPRNGLTKVKHILYVH